MHFTRTLKFLTITLALGISSIVSAQSETERDATSTFPVISKAETEGEWKPHMGLTAGYAESTNNYDGAGLIGLDVGFQPVIPFGVGVEFTHFSTDKNSGSQQVDLERTQFMGRGTYNFGGTMPVIKSSYVGLAAGLVFDREDDRNKTNMGVAPMVGVDFPIGSTEITRKSFSLGANVSYLFVGGPASDTFGANALVKYWY